MRGIALGYNAVPARAKQFISQVFESGQYSPGPRVKEFEEAFAELHGAKHAVFVNSGTDALRLALLACKEKWGWKDGDQVAVPALTFVATVNVIIQAGLKPFFVDVSMHDFLMNPWNLERRMEGGLIKNLRAVMPVHLFGKSCGPEIYALAKKLKLKVIEDSCETIANAIQGDVSCHSTYMAHHITTGVGGMAVTDDEDLNLIMRSLANHGRNTDYLPGYYKAPLSKELLAKRFQFDRVGYSCRGTEFEAALGLSQMQDVEKNVCKRQEVAVLLQLALRDVRDFCLPSFRYGDAHTFMMFPIVLKETSKLKKYDLCLYLEENGIETRDMMPITSQPCFQHLDVRGCRVAEWVNRNGFYVAVNPGMGRTDVLHVKNVVSQYLTKQA